MKQEGYRSDDPGQTYLSTFPAAHPDGLTSYTGLREVPPVWIVIDKETAFDASMPGQWLRVTEKGVLTVGKIGENGVFPLVNDLELQDGGQIRFADDGVLGQMCIRDKSRRAYRRPGRDHRQPYLQRAPFPKGHTRGQDGGHADARHHIGRTIRARLRANVLFLALPMVFPLEDIP